MSGYTIEQQMDMVMEHSDLVTNEYVEAICTECGTTYAKPILDPNGEINLQPQRRR